jgi:hypothetical protein
MRRARAAAATAIGLAGALVAAVACEQVLSIDGAVKIARHDACSLAVPPGSCQTCVASSCCSQASACAGSQACAAYESCLLACGSDYQCRTQCAVTHGAGQDPNVWALDQCVASSCNDACGMSCGITAVPTYPDAAAGCEACIAERACSAVQACAASTACEEIEHCSAGCSTIDCHDACQGPGTDDAGTFVALEAALISSCIHQCHLGNFWLCVGGVNWPLAPAGVNQVDFTAVDSTSGQGLPGAAVKACGRTDGTCAIPQAQATADDAGRGVLDFPSHPAVGLGFEGYYDIDASGEMPWLLFASSPLTRSPATFTWSLLSQSQFASTFAAVGVTPNSTLAAVIVEAEDCLLSPASHVTFSALPMDPSTKLFYISGGGLTDLTTETDITGFAFFVNVPIGSITIQATPKELGKVSSTQVVFTRPGAVSTVIMLPTP